MIKALIFDVDGTLSETEELHRLAFNRAFAMHGLVWEWSRTTYRRLLLVTGGKERIRHFMAGTPNDGLLVTDRTRFIHELHLAKTEIYTDLVRSRQASLRPGIREVIAEATRRNVRLAIATTTSLPNVDALLKATLGENGSELFEAICAGDMVKKKKPAPDVYRMVLEELGLRADQCIAIEDSRNGLLSAVGAGIRTLVTPSMYTDGQDFSEAALVVPDLRDERVANGLLFQLADRHTRLFGRRFLLAEQ